ncbi:hypothetical protein [Streptomyces minutiscleroticus]|uniref:hypothetical protein n=1 Tax=Streptomyces minutiscleroticus TaxID=68238 RepID=UPI00332E052A
MDRTVGPERPHQESKESAVGRTAREDVQHGASVVREKGQDVAGTVREGAGQVLQETTDQGRDLYKRFVEQASEESGAQVRRLSSTVRHLVEDLQHMSESAKPESPAASLVQQMAERGHVLADRLDRQGPGELLEDVRDFARRRPGLFLAGAALAGFAVSRLGRGVTAADGAPDESGAEERAGAARQSLPEAGPQPEAQDGPEAEQSARPHEPPPTHPTHPPVPQRPERR